MSVVVVVAIEVEVEVEVVMVFVVVVEEDSDEIDDEWKAVGNPVGVEVSVRKVSGVLIAVGSGVGVEVEVVEIIMGNSVVSRRMESGTSSSSCSSTSC